MIAALWLDLTAEDSATTDNEGVYFQSIVASTDNPRLTAWDKFIVQVASLVPGGVTKSNSTPLIHPVPICAVVRADLRLLERRRLLDDMHAVSGQANLPR